MYGLTRKASSAKTKLYIDWVVKGGQQKELIQYSPKVDNVMSVEEMSGEYDLLINLSPSFHPNDPSVSFKESAGFNFDEKSQEIYEILYGGRKTTMNQFQVYYKLIGLNWRGEGYGIKYYPKSRQKKKSAGISIDHLKLRHYVSDNISLKGLKVSMLKYRKNVFKRMDDLNRYQHIVTDDLLTMNLAVYLRKNVHYLETIPLNTKPEFFGNGRVYGVPANIVK